MSNTLTRLMAGAALAALLTPAGADAYGAAYHTGYTHAGPNGVYHAGSTTATAGGYRGGATGGAYHTSYTTTAGGGAYRAGFGGGPGQTNYTNVRGGTNYTNFR